MNEMMANFQQSVRDVRSTTKGVGDGKRTISDGEVRGIVDQLAQMEGTDRTQAINFVRKTDPELRSLLRQYQPIAPAQR